MKTFNILTLAATISIALPAPAQTIRHGKIRIDDPWARETAPGAKTGAGYLRIANGGKFADRLLGGSTPAAAKLEIHTMTMTGGIMRMRPLPRGVAIPALGGAALDPGGNHIMLIGLKAPLKRGTTIPVTLRFEKAGTITVRFAVRPVSATGPARHGEHR